ncbi:glycosyltransferase family 2 protein [Arcanobacterium phocisimile]|uniref:Glycosyltransferase family 2 protein n=1 Tax=Arcanobacterium phocisimile TaxID=1302235 RepID=A0ABX7IJI5_9ACTO|nr:glycosyltransferase family 2 protein [Arcanobacterium phocisimile]QRV02255.1 glycosyltransferase family 2 protein [Arcanobacterium phocisimile]
MNFSAISAVVVTYHPQDVNELLGNLALQCTEVIVVDNSEVPPEHLIDTCNKTHARLLSLGKNVGIAAAQNIGIDLALNHGAEAIILFDQDSVPGSSLVLELAHYLADDVAAVGPTPYDGDEPLVYTDHTWGPKRPRTRLDSTEPIDVSFLLASGCLIRADVLREVGFMPAEYFIDHVDLAWCMRARAYGYRLLAIPTVQLPHSLGDKGIKIKGRSKTIHVHSPIRNYYLTRNTIEVMRNPDLPLRWRIRYGYWITRFAAFTLLTSSDRGMRGELILRGVRDGLRRRMGKIH